VRFYYHGPAIGSNRRLQPAKGRMVSTVSYAKFKEALAVTFLSQKNGLETIKKPQEVSLDILIRCPPKADPTNFLKPIADALEVAEVYENDRQVAQVKITESVTHSKPGHATFVIAVGIGAGRTIGGEEALDAAEKNA